MTPDHSRRNFLRYVPGVFLLASAARNVAALSAPQQSPPTTGNGAQPPNHQSNSGQPPGPAQHAGDYEPPTLSGTHDRSNDKDPAPRKPRKDLAADQKLLRDEVQRLALDAQELSKAVAQFGPKQPLTADLVGKTKEIERLARDIAVLAKG
jgi:hypothetical protein